MCKTTQHFIRKEEKIPKLQVVRWYVVCCEHESLHNGNGFPNFSRWTTTDCQEIAKH